MNAKNFLEVWSALPFEELKKSLAVEAARAFRKTLHVAILNKHELARYNGDEEEALITDITTQDIVTNKGNILKDIFSHHISDNEMILLSNICQELMSSLLRVTSRAECRVDLSDDVVADIAVIVDEQAEIKWNNMVIRINRSDLEKIA